VVAGTWLVQVGVEFFLTVHSCVTVLLPFVTVASRVLSPDGNCKLVIATNGLASETGVTVSPLSLNVTIHSLEFGTMPNVAGAAELAAILTVDDSGEAATTEQLIEVVAAVVESIKEKSLLGFSQPMQNKTVPAIIPAIGKLIFDNRIRSAICAS